MSETHQSSIMCLIVKNKKNNSLIYPKANVDIKILITSSEIYKRGKNESPYFNDFPFILQKDSGCIALNFIKVLSKIDQ